MYIEDKSKQGKQKILMNYLFNSVSLQYINDNNNIE